MKAFFQKKSVAVTITLIVVAIAVVIGFTTAPKQAPAQTAAASQSTVSASSWAKKNYEQYEAFLDDDADLFDSSTLETIAQYDAQLDYGYGSIVGLVTTDSLDGKSMEDYAIDVYKRQLLDNPEFYIVDNLGTYYAAFNCKSPLFADKTPEQAACMREAFSLLIDRDYIVENVGQRCV